MTVIIRPRDLVGKKNVSFHFTDDETYAPAWVSGTPDAFTDKITSFTVTISKFTCRKFFILSNLDPALFDQWYAGVLIHEILHILNDTLNHGPHIQKDGIAAYIWNVIVDAHDERKGSYWFPSYSPYITIITQVLKRQPPNIPDDDINRDLQSWFHLVRYQEVPDNSDPDFMDFALPMCLAGTRGSIQDAQRASIAIYEYLRIKHVTNNQKQKAWMDGIIDHDAQDGKYQVILYDPNASPQEKGDAPGQQAGDEKVEIDFSELDESFYTSVLLQESDAITTIENRLNQYINQEVETLENEGDLGMEAGQLIDAYMGSFTGDEPLSYLMHRMQELDIKIVVCTDISYSTSDISEQYARATVIFLASFDRFFPGIKTALIQFNAQAQLIYGFDEPIKKGAIRPKANGGTDLGPAIDLIETMTLDAIDNVVIVITDGYLSDFQSDQMRLQALQNTNHLIFELVPDYSTEKVNPGAIRTTVGDLSSKATTAFIKTVLKNRGQRS